MKNETLEAVLINAEAHYETVTLAGRLAGRAIVLLNEFLATPKVERSTGDLYLVRDLLAAVDHFHVQLDSSIHDQLIVPLRTGIEG